MSWPGTPSSPREHPHRKHGGGRSVLDLELVIDLLQMLVYRARAAGEDRGDVAIRFSLRDPEEYLRFPFGEVEALAQNLILAMGIAVSDANEIFR